MFKFTFPKRNLYTNVEQQYISASKLLNTATHHFNFGNRWQNEKHCLQVAGDSTRSIVVYINPVSKGGAH